MSTQPLSCVRRQVAIQQQKQTTLLSVESQMFIGAIFQTLWRSESERTAEGVMALQVRKAYNKSTLQLHPDKALVQCRFSVKLGSQGLALASRSEVEPSTPPDALHWQ